MIEDSKLRVAIDLYSIIPGEGGSGGGIWTYAYNMVKTIDELVGKHYYRIDVICFTNTNIKLDTKNITVVQIPFFIRNVIWRMIWIHFILPLLCLGYRINVVHKLASEISLFSFIPVVVTIHDLITEYLLKKKNGHSSLFQKLKYYYFAFITRYAVNNSRYIFVVSKIVKRDLLKTYTCGAGKILVTYNGTQQKANLVYITRPLTENVILYIAAYHRHKNHLNAVKAFELLLTQDPSLSKNTKLIFRGHVKDVSYHKLIVDEVNKSKWKENFIFINYNVNDSLEKIYDGTILLNLSLFEGFGLPIIEAQSFGLPVICSDIEIFREIAGNSALFVNNNDYEGIAEQLHMLIKNKEEYKRLSTLGLENSKKYTWEKMAEIVLETYSQAGK